MATRQHRASLCLLPAWAWYLPGTSGLGDSTWSIGCSAMSSSSTYLWLWLSELRGGDSPLPGAGASPSPRQGLCVCSSKADLRAPSAVKGSPHLSTAFSLVTSCSSTSAPPSAQDWVLPIQLPGNQRTRLEGSWRPGDLPGEFTYVTQPRLRGQVLTPLGMCPDPYAPILGGQFLFWLCCLHLP